MKKETQEITFTVQKGIHPPILNISGNSLVMFLARKFLKMHIFCITTKKYKVVEKIFAEHGEVLTKEDLILYIIECQRRQK